MTIVFYFSCKRKGYVYGPLMSEIKPTRKIKGTKGAPTLKTYRMPADLIERIAYASARTGLKPADVVRLSIKDGVAILLSKLEGDAQ